jgi:isopentenyl-diphosphate Delta-isomerase
MITQEVILVNEKDEEVGTMEKMEAHQRGLLHRAFSVFIFDKQGRMLLQQRAQQKYHGAHLWTNACCSHPYPGEITQKAAVRRLKEELGFTAQLDEVFAFLYKADVENNLVEHEYDHVFAGEYEGVINPNEAEVANVDYRKMVDIKTDIEINSSHYTSWFKIAFPRIEKWWKEKYNNVNVNTHIG